MSKDEITVTIPVCDARAIQASEYASTRIEDALRQWEQHANPLKTPWSAELLGGSHTYWVVVDVERNATGITKEMALLRAAAPELADALKYAVDHERTSSFDFDYWHPLAMAALRKAGAL